MKKILYLTIALFFCVSCESFLDVESYTKKDSSNFPLNETDAVQLLTGVYTTLNRSNNYIDAAFFFVSELASDDRYGGGMEDDKNFQAIDHLMYNNLNIFQGYWSARYRGINRANMAIANLNNVTNEEVRNQKIGEALFLRAYSYFELVQFFGDIPLIAQAPENVKEAQTPPIQVSQEEIFKTIASDLKEAYSIMPSYSWNYFTSGTVTKWAVAGLMARIYLFYTGFYQKTSLPTLDGEISKAEVISALNDCIQNSGHGLVSDFRSLWPYTNSLTKKDYAYASDAPDWVRDGENKEQVFVIKHTRLATWSNPGFANQYSCYFGIPNTGEPDRYYRVFPFGQGWGGGPVAPNLWNEWKIDNPDDMRRVASIFSVEDESVNYRYGGDGTQIEETGFWQKKIIGTRAYKDDGTLWNCFSSSRDYYGDGISDNFQLGNETDIAIIRYADILLMHSELTETADGMNAVRARSGLSPVSYSLELLKKERRYELAFEGLRWGDIRRWHEAEIMLPKQLGYTLYNRGIATPMKDQGAGYAARYKATNGFFPIPQSEIDLSQGTMKQNEGWGPDALYVGWY